MQQNQSHNAQNTPTPAVTALVPMTTKEARSLYHVANKSSFIEADKNIIFIIDELKELEEKKKKILQTEDALKTNIMNYMQGNSALKSGNTTLATWQGISKQCFDLGAFSKKHKKLHAAFMKETTSRVFRLC